MLKPTLFLGALPAIITPALSVVACATTETSFDTQGTTELSRLTFYLFKTELLQIPFTTKPINAADFKATINSWIRTQPLIKEHQIDVQADGTDFIVVYKLVVLAGSFEEANINLNQIKETDVLSGSIRVSTTLPN